MKKYHLVILLLFMIISCDKNKELKPLIVGKESGLIVDNRDGQEYKWIRVGDLDWLVTNLRYKTSKGNCKVYLDSDLTNPEKESIGKDNLEKYGYLYDYEAAAEAVIEGWRLPTDDDWKKLEEHIGMSNQDIDRLDWRAAKHSYILKRIEGSPTLDLRLGGFYNYWGNKYTANALGVYGYYWTSSVDVSKVEPSAFYRQVSLYDNKINRNSTLRLKCMSVRCVRDKK